MEANDAERLEAWRQWARFVFTSLTAEDISIMSDAELREIVCAVADVKQASSPDATGHSTDFPTCGV
jgi:hypothetical protein